MHAIAIVAVTNGFGNKRRPITTFTVIAEARLKPHLSDAEWDCCTFDSCVPTVVV